MVKVIVLLLTKNRSKISLTPHFTLFLHYFVILNQLLIFTNFVVFYYSDISPRKYFSDYLSSNLSCHLEPSHILLLNSSIMKVPIYVCMNTCVVMYVCMYVCIYI